MVVPVPLRRPAAQRLRPGRGGHGAAAGARLRVVTASDSDSAVTVSLASRGTRTARLTRMVTGPGTGQGISQAPLRILSLVGSFPSRLVRFLRALQSSPGPRPRFTMSNPAAHSTAVRFKPGAVRPATLPSGPTDSEHGFSCQWLQVWASCQVPAAGQAALRGKAVGRPIPVRGILGRPKTPAGRPITHRRACNRGRGHVLVKQNNDGRPIVTHSY